MSDTAREFVVAALPWLIGVPTLAAVFVLAAFGAAVALALWALRSLLTAMGIRR